MDWKSGSFEKQRLSSALHVFTPAHAVDHLTEIDLDLLWERGKRLLLLDVDNTLVQWKQDDFAEPVIAWIEKAKAMGFGICLVSNTKHLERLERLKNQLGVETVRGRFKPSRAMFRLAMIKFKAKPDQTIMVGDQLMTDIVGANRTGLEAYWVRKMEGREFKGTSMVNRRLERFFQGMIYRALVAPIDESPDFDAQKPLEEKSVVHQLIKFAIVGGTSFVIDYCIRMTLMFAVPYNGGLLSEKAGGWLRTALPLLFGHAENDQKAFVPIAAAIAASVAIVNSFIWNRLWTFEIRGTAERTRQLQKFVAVSLIGLGINVTCTTIFNHVLPFDTVWNFRIATVLAAATAAIWNFTGSRYFAFRKKAT